ncbi:hypothetical protein MTR67_042995 [Solanum verrucosum]|uniref:Uncharacterized protein n=1 Tax=Solanum verrucosum TaxID=315347 RepID=A0AAF0ZU93_SOLVR|nr:hypothetical protein MTR67_042995 [Solanum verrucosum]
MLEQAKKARGSLTGGLLHTGSAKSVGTITREIEKELGRPPLVPEVCKRTHGEYNQYVNENLDSSVQMTQEMLTQIWIEKVIGGTHKGRVFGRGSKNDLRRLQSGLECIGSSHQVEAVDGVQIVVMLESKSKTYRSTSRV